MGERRRRRRCHTPDKTPFRFKAEAKRAARDASAHYRHEIDAYECRSCGAWHLTRRKR